MERRLKIECLDLADQASGLALNRDGLRPPLYKGARTHQGEERKLRKVTTSMTRSEAQPQAVARSPGSMHTARLCPAMAAYGRQGTQMDVIHGEASTKEQIHEEVCHDDLTS